MKHVGIAPMASLTFTAGLSALPSGSQGSDNDSLPPPSASTFGCRSSPSAFCPLPSALEETDRARKLRAPGPHPPNTGYWFDFVDGSVDGSTDGAAAGGAGGAGVCGVVVADFLRRAAVSTTLIDSHPRTRARVVLRAHLYVLSGLIR